MTEPTGESSGRGAGLAMLLIGGAGTAYQVHTLLDRNVYIGELILIATAVLGLGVGKLVHGAALPLGPQGRSVIGIVWACLGAAVGAGLMIWAHHRGG